MPPFPLKRLWSIIRGVDRFSTINYSLEQDNYKLTDTPQDMNDLGEIFDSYIYKTNLLELFDRV